MASTAPVILTQYYASRCLVSYGYWATSSSSLTFYSSQTHHSCLVIIDFRQRSTLSLIEPENLSHLLVTFVIVFSSLFINIIFYRQLKRESSLKNNMVCLIACRQLRDAYSESMCLLLSSFVMNYHSNTTQDDVSPKVEQTWTICSGFRRKTCIVLHYNHHHSSLFPTCKKCLWTMCVNWISTFF